jgi:hypothetical protein
MEITFGNNYKAILRRDYLTYRESIEIQKILLKGTGGLKPNPEGKVDFELKDPTVVFEMNLKMFEFLIEKIIDDKGVEHLNVRDYIMDLKQEVVEDLLNKINEITKKK